MSFLWSIIVNLLKGLFGWAVDEAKKPIKAKDSTPVPSHIRERWDDKFDDDGVPKPRSGGRKSRFRGQ